MISCKEIIIIITIPEILQTQLAMRMTSISSTASHVQIHIPTSTFTAYHCGSAYYY